MDMPVKNRDEIAFCGLRCGSCILGKGASKEKAKQILEEISDLDLDNWHEQLLKQEPFNYDDFKKGLKWLTTLDCNGCHAGGGDPECTIRKCGKEKGLSNCGECSEMPCDIMKKWGIGMEKNFESQ